MPMERRADIIDIAIRVDRSGWIVATSDDLPGLFIAHTNATKLVTDISVTIEALYKTRHGMDADVVPRRDREANLHSWIAIPAHVAASHPTE